MAFSQRHDRQKRIEEWKKLESEYAAVKERIKQRLDEAENGSKK